MTQEEPFIPIDDQLNNFNIQLENNNRLFFSAKFGDGKTTFLNEFKKQKEDKYQIITLFPINYQIVDNKDIFELIKRDILLQLLMLEDLVLKNKDIIFIKQLAGYFKENSIDIAEDLFVSATSIFSNVPFFPDMKEPLERLFKNINKFKTHTKEADEKHNQKKQTKKFLTNTNVCIYEFDAISQLIYMLIKQYKEKKGKDIVLIIEDLDRIDPKHLFRLLNIFSSHFDRVNKGSNEEKSNLTDNKFGFDKIVFVCDYYNIKSIFHHFYGDGTDFKGYITKFSSVLPFRYSLKKSYNNYIVSILPKTISQYECISNILSGMIIDKYSQKDILKIDQESLRTIKEKINQPYNIKPKSYIYNKEKPTIKIHSINNLTILIDLLNRFDYTFKDFRSNIDMGNHKMKLIGFIGESWCLSEFISEYEKGRIGFKTGINSGTSLMVNLDDINNLNESNYATIIQGISTVLSRINESNIFLDDITISI